MDMYIGKCGAANGQADDEITINSESVADAMRQLLRWLDDRWPDSDGEYGAVCWIEDPAGEVLASEEVTITAGGQRL